MEDNLLREFLAEAEDLMEVLLGDVESLRLRRTEGRERRELLARTFRHLHSLKGSAATFELEAVGQLAHEIETLLDSLRLGQLALDDEVLDALDDAAVALSNMLDAAARAEIRPAPSSLIERLRHLASNNLQAVSQGNAPLPAALPADIARDLSAHETARLAEARAEGARLFVVEVNFDAASFDERFRALSDVLKGSGEIIHTWTSLDQSSPDRISFRLVYATPRRRESLAASINDFGPVALTEMDESPKSKVQSPKSEGQSRESAVESLESEVESSGSEVENQEPALIEEGAGIENELDEGAVVSIAPLNSVVRVELDELDELIYAAHELFKEAFEMLAQVPEDSQVREESVGQARERSPAEASLSLAERLDAGEAEKSVERGSERGAYLRRRFVELEEQLIGLRMIPVSRMLRRAARAGAMAARQVGKKVDFEVAGEEVRLDKFLIEAVSDPLLHLVRNAVDHGIELSDERERLGKSARGVVRIEACAEGNRARLRVSDDGRGIEPARIASAARSQGITPAGPEMGQEQALRLIFRPGFSTAPYVNRISGRGVGLDVVESVVEQLGGEVRVQSEPGAGTTFELLLPATLALVNALLVRAGGHHYCIEEGQVAETLMLDAFEVEHDGARELIRWRGEALPLLSLSSLLAQTSAASLTTRDSERLHVIVARVAGPVQMESQEGLARQAWAAVEVEGWTGYVKLLVRGLGRHAARWHAVGGAAELNDGTAALLLDLPRLLDSALMNK